MKKLFKFCLTVTTTLLLFTTFGQNISSFSGSKKSSINNYNFYNPLVSGNKTFSNSIVNIGPIQFLNDTTVVLDTSLEKYDLDSIPEQLVFYNTACKFYIKKDSLEKLNKTVVKSQYYVTSGNPLGVLQLNRLNMVQYLTNTDTLDFSLRFALITSTNDTVKSKKDVHFKIVPALPFENATFGVGGQPKLPDPEGSEFRVQTINTDFVATDTFNFIPNQKLRTINYSGVQVVLENDSKNNNLFLNNNATDIDTLNLYAETLIIKGRFNFPQTTVNIYARELRFEDFNGKPSYLSTTPDSSAILTGRKGLKAGDIYLHILNFTANPGKHFLLNGGNGEGGASGPEIGEGGSAGNLYSTVNVKDYTVADGGYSGNYTYDPAVTYKGASGKYFTLNQKASWLHPNFLHIIVNYYKEGFYSGLTVPVVQKLGEYSDLLDKYSADSSIKGIESGNLLQIKQIVGEVRQVFFNIRNNLDYFGNPPGWVPMLSFEVAKSAYINEARHALSILYLDQLIQNANSSLAQRQAVFANLRDESRGLVNANIDEYTNIATVQIPGLKSDIQNNQYKISSLQQQLVQINNELDAKAKEKYDNRQTWKWVGVASNVLSSIPTPYTQVAGAALSIGTQVFANDDQKAGFQNGGKLANTITKTLEPFTSGNVTSEVSDVFNNVSNGTDDIFNDIDNMKNISDAVKIGKEASKLYTDNKELVDKISQSVSGVVNLYNSITSVNSDELGSIKGELLANEPRIGIIAEQIQAVQNDQVKLAQRLQTSTEQMLSSKNNIDNGLSAISKYNASEFVAASAFDHQLAVYSNDMRRKAFERLRLYHYYMVKAYEYRLLKVYPGDLNLTPVINKIKDLIATNTTSGTIPSGDIDKLFSIYDEEMHQVAADLYTYYQSNFGNGVISTTFKLSGDEVKELNKNKSITLNLIEKGLFRPSEEDIRIVGLQVKKIVYKPLASIGNSDDVQFKFVYPNYSRLKKNGMIYSFNNYNLATEFPMYWNTRIDLLDPSQPPIIEKRDPATGSLLSSLLNDLQAPTGKSDLYYYSSPSAWADIKLGMDRFSDGLPTSITIDSIIVTVEYSYLPKPENIVNVELNTNKKWFAPTFEISDIDKYNRKSGIGDVHRAYDLAVGKKVKASTPKKYGRYNFIKWTDRNGNDLVNGNGIDITKGNTISFSLEDDRSFKAMYKFEGAILNIPDTVYLNDKLTYSLRIKNTGSGPLYWSFDSSSSWIKSQGNKGINDTTVNLTFDKNNSTKNTRIGLLDVACTETEFLHHFVYFVQAKANKPPVVSITSPASNTTYTAPANITIKANASDADGTISSVKFYKDTTNLKTFISAPYTYNLSNLPAGTYIITAKAIDNNGAQTISSPITVKVSAAPTVSNKPLFENPELSSTADPKMRLAPNPTDNILTVFIVGLKQNEPLNLMVISSSGAVMKTVQSISSATAIKLDVASLVSGVYTVKLNCGDKVLVKEFLKL